MNLLTRLNELVIPTTQTRKITINGKTKIYPVYKVRLDAVYYNDQNDRIASYVSQYKSEHGKDIFDSLDKESYNSIIEKFIVSSNPLSIEKTQNNIRLVGQREAGVILEDGRIIDGNRRYTCLRRINKVDKEVCWFETVILDMDINDSKKLIKMLELTIQHGEEKKVDYNRVELLIGVYQDIVETGLLTVEEYAASINESIPEVKRRVESSKLLIDFLDYIGMPKQYHIAREYQIVSLINDLQDILKRVKSSDYIEKLKKVTFMNFFMGGFTDERKFIKDITMMIQNENFDDYYEEEEEIEERIEERKQIQVPSNLSEIKQFTRVNSDLVDMLKDCLERYANGAKRTEIKKRPQQIVNKSINSLKEIDLRIIKKLDEDEKAELMDKVSIISKMTEAIGDAADDDKNNHQKKEEVKPTIEAKPVASKNCILRPYLKPADYNNLVIIDSLPSVITNLIFSVELHKKGDSEDIELFFIDDNYELISKREKITLTKDVKKIAIELESKASSKKCCYLVIKNASDSDNEARYMYKLGLDITFDTDFNF